MESNSVNSLQVITSRLRVLLNHLLAERSIPLLLIAFACVVRLRNLNSPITGSYTFRYTQTAWGIRSVFRGVNSPFSVEMPVLGEPWKVPFEFPLFQILAGFASRITRLDPQISGRLTSLTFFLLSAYVFFRIVRRFSSLIASVFALAVFLFCAHNLEYGSAVLIEYCALFFGLSAFISASNFLDSQKPRTLGLFFISSTLVGLVKITTAVIWVGFGTIALLILFKASFRKTVTLLVTVAASQVPALLWTRWADHQKGSSIWTAWLTSSNLSVWNFGSLRQRLFYFDWHRSVILEFFPSVLGTSMFVITLAILAISSKSTRREATAFMVLFFAGPLVFTNLYFVHDYYWTAVLPALLIVLALGAGGLSESTLFRELFSKFNVRLLAVLAVSSMVITSWFSTYGSRHFDVFARPGRIDLNSSNDLVAVEQLQLFTTPDDRIVVVGADWNPSILYFADRQGLMIRNELSADQKLATRELRDSFDYVLLFSKENLGGPIWAEISKHNTLVKVTDVLYKILE